MRPAFASPALAVSAALALALLAASPAAAQWSSDPSANLAVSIAPNVQTQPVVVSTGDGGSIAVWNDQRSGTQAIFGQRFDAAGFAQWAANGLALATPATDTGEMAAVSDFSGGAIVAWFDAHTGTMALYAQRFAANGAPQWTADGVTVTASGLSFSPMVVLVPDGAGGANIVWSTSGAPGVSRLYAQRIDASGQLMWSGPVSVSTDTTHASRPQVDADGAGGVVIAWSSFRSVTDDVYAQHIDAGGTRLWGDAGVAVAPSTTFTRFLPGVVSDANGGAVVVWLQFHPAAAGERVTAIRQDLFAQRLDGNGAAQWAADGQQLSLNMHLGSQDTVCTDGAGGAYVVYYGDSLRVQHVTVAGGLPWGPAGLAMTNANVFLWTPMVRSPDGGVIVCWGPYATYPLVAAQSIRPDGQLRWGPQGVMVSTASSVHSYPALAADPYGGATFAWSDTRNGGNFSNADIYAQRVGASGTLGLPAEPPHAIRLALASAPCPARGADPVQLRFALPADGRVRLALYDLSGRLVRVLVDEQKAMGWRTADWDGRDGNGRIAPAGVYLARLTGAVGVADTRIVRLP